MDELPPEAYREEARRGQRLPIRGYFARGEDKDTLGKLVSVNAYQSLELSMRAGCRGLAAIDTDRPLELVVRPQADAPWVAVVLELERPEAFPPRADETLAKELQDPRWSKASDLYRIRILCQQRVLRGHFRARSAAVSRARHSGSGCRR